MFFKHIKNDYKSLKLKTTLKRTKKTQNIFIQREASFAQNWKESTQGL